MTTEIRGPRRVPLRARLDDLQRLLKLQKPGLRHRREALRTTRPAEACGATDYEEHCTDAQGTALEALVLELTTQTVKEIEAALLRARSGTYGLCCDCGSEVPAARLKALPFATVCCCCQETRDSAPPKARATRNGLLPLA
jgi:DnaK suppressor protein